MLQPTIAMVWRLLLPIFNLSARDEKGWGGRGGEEKRVDPQGKTTLRAPACKYTEMGSGPPGITARVYVSRKSFCA